MRLIEREGRDAMANLTRETRLQIMLTEAELRALDDWRFKFRLPSRASAVRELLRKGLAAEGMTVGIGNRKSADYGVTDGTSATGKRKRSNGAAKSV
jgi:hypothetical protein